MAIYTLRVKDYFEASHWLRSYRGQPEQIHGHSWAVEVLLEADRLDDEGMGFDFVEIRGHLRELAARFDHNDINSVEPFDTLSPTTEHIARWFHGELSSRMPDAGVAAVTVWEGPHCSATFRPH